jgi:hypothetical protein
MRAGFIAVAASSSGGPGTPGYVENVVGTTGVGQISVSWAAPLSNGGSAITDYTVEYSSDGGSSWTTFTDGVSTSTSATVTGLANSTTYILRVQAINAIGAGPYTLSDPVSTPTTPGAPTSVSGTQNGVTTSTVSWTAPASNGGSNINGYRVEYAISPYSSYTVFSADTGNTNTSILVTGLTDGGSYKFRITAKNLVGFGPTSAESGVVVTNVVPAAPTIGTMTLSTTSTVDSLAWTAPTSNGGSAITEYVYQTTTNDGSTFSGAISTGSTAVSRNFDPGYTNVITKVRVAAVNSLGTGPYSAVSAVGFGGWSSESASIANPTLCPLPTCTCPACPSCDGGCDGCGTRTVTGSPGTSTGTRGTSSRTCYRWARGAQATGYIYDQNSTNACSSSYSACTEGECSACTADTCGCSACSGSWGSVYPFGSVVQLNDGRYVNFSIWGPYYSDSAGNGTQFCAGGSGFTGPSDVQQCSVTSAYRAVAPDVCIIPSCC